MYLIVVPFLLLLRQANSQAVSVDWGNYCPSVKKNRLLFFFVPGNTQRKKNTPKRHKILLKRELLKGSRVVFDFKSLLDKNFLTLSLSSWKEASFTLPEIVFQWLPIEPHKMKITRWKMKPEARFQFTLNVLGPKINGCKIKEQLIGMSCAGTVVASCYSYRAQLLTSYNQSDLPKNIWVSHMQSIKMHFGGNLIHWWAK